MKFDLVSLLPVIPFTISPNGLSSVIISLMPSVLKLALPDKVFIPVEPEKLLLLISTPAIKLGSIAAPN